MDLARRLGDSGPTFPRTEHCEVCQARTTHVRQGCTKCMGRADNRKQGLLFLAIGAPLLVLGVAGLVGRSETSMLDDHGARIVVSGPVVPRWAAGMVLGFGVLVTGQGLRGALYGQDPEG